MCIANLQKSLVWYFRKAVPEFILPLGHWPRAERRTLFRRDEYREQVRAEMEFGAPPGGSVEMRPTFPTIFGYGSVTPL